MYFRLQKTPAPAKNPWRFRFSNRLGLCCLLPLLLLLAGCQNNRRVNWNPLNWGNLERLPPPPTGSLNIPGLPNPYINSNPFPNSGSGLLSGNLPPPPNSIANNQFSGAGFPGNAAPAGAINSPAPGVYFPSAANSFPNQVPGTVPGTFGGGTFGGGIPGIDPATGQPLSSPWQTSSSPGNVQPYINPGTGANSGGGILNAIPGREQNGGNAFNIGSVANNVAAGANRAGFDLSAVPPLAGNFDPFDTSRVPTWNSPLWSGASTASNPLLNTGNAAVPPASQSGWWPTQGNGGSGNNLVASGEPGWGRGRLWQRLSNAAKSTFQPANLGGFQTTAPIDNPMILATAYDPNAPATGGLGNLLNNLPNPAAYSQARDAQAAYQLQQAQLQAYQQAQVVAYQNALAAANRSGTNPGGAGAMQVLAENTTSEVAENQSRTGVRTAAAPVDPRYAGGQAASGFPNSNPAPLGSAAAARGPIQSPGNATGLIQARDQSNINSAWNPSQVR